MMRIRIEADDDGIRQEFRDARVCPERIEEGVVDSGQEILAKAADRFRGPQQGAADLFLVEADQRAVSFTDFYDAVLDGHACGLYNRGVG